MARQKPQHEMPHAADVSSTSRSLLVRLRENQPDAWRRLVNLYTPLVCYWCRKLSVPTQDTVDVVQDVFRAVTANIKTYRRDRPGDTFRGWLRTITRSKVMDYYRALADDVAGAGGTAAQLMLAQHPDSLSDLEDDDCEMAETSIHHAVLHHALTLVQSEFREKTWQAFWRIVIDGRSPKDVAEELAMKPGTVRVAKCRVLQRLRAELGEFAEDGSPVS